MYNLKDDIIALATLVGNSALSIIRISGKQSIDIYQQLTKTKTRPRPNYVKLAFIYHPKKQITIDQATIVYYRGPKSFTGEDCLEITIHGGAIIANQLLDACLSIGLREAMPGEFSYRAFINNKIDLLQAEAISSIISANNDLDSYYALGAIKGNLSNKIQESYNIIKNIITTGEHELDFNENEITFLDIKEYLRRLTKAHNVIQKTINQSYTLEDNKSSLKIAIIGAPNAGKSSLFNIIIGKSKAIVTDIKGTTRDSLEQPLYIKDNMVTLIDTAGIRKTKNKIEKMGVQKSLEEIKGSDILIIVDENNPETILKKLQTNIKQKEILLVQNKIDVNDKCNNGKVIFISCKKRLGISKLITTLSTLINKKTSVFESQYSHLINQRQKNILDIINNELSTVILNYKKHQDLTLCLSSLYSVLDLFNTLIRPIEKNEILNNIFKGFCVGK